MDYKNAWVELQCWLEKELAAAAADGDVSLDEYFLLQTVYQKMYFIERQ